MIFQTLAIFQLQGKLSRVGTLHGCVMTGIAGWYARRETGPAPSPMPTLGISPNHVSTVYKTQVLADLIFRFELSPLSLAFWGKIIQTHSETQQNSLFPKHQPGPETEALAGISGKNSGLDLRRCKLLLRLWLVVCLTPVASTP